MVSSSLHIDVCSFSVLYNLLSFFRLSILTSAVFSSVYFTLLYSSRHIDIFIFSVLYFTSFASSLHIDICNISVLRFTLLALSLDIYICSLAVLYILVCFPRLCILTSAVFQFRRFDFAFLLSAYWHLHVFSSLYLTCFPRLCILISAVFQFYVCYFAFFDSAYCYLQYLSSVDFSLLFFSLHNGIYSISIM